MNDYLSRPDGEYYVDAVEKPIPPQSTWVDMSAPQLLEVKSSLQTKLWQFRNSPQVANTLKQSIAKLDVLISQSLR
jgi:hypothetical protein